MCDKSFAVQQSIPLTMIIKDALKQRTPSLLSLPHTLRLCNLAVIWKLSAFSCLLSSFWLFVCLPTPTPALALKPNQPSSLSREGDSWWCLSKGRTSHDYDTVRRSTATNSLSEGCPVNQSSQWPCCCSWERGCSRWQLKDQLMDSAADCLHTQQNAGTVFMAELCTWMDYLSGKSSLWYVGRQCHSAD